MELVRHQLVPVVEMVVLHKYPVGIVEDLAMEDGWVKVVEQVVVGNRTEVVLNDHLQTFS